MISKHASRPGADPSLKPPVAVPLPSGLRSMRHRSPKPYHVFGGTLLSELDFPELPDGGSGAADWRLDARSAAEPARTSVYLGEDEVEKGVRVRLFRHAAGYRLEFDDTGTFDVELDGARVSWSPGPREEPESIRLDVLGRALPLALHASGALTLHGSAVAIGGVGVGFLAPKYHGKSTLAQALVAAGALLATDDALPVELQDEVCMRPGVHRARLWSDSLAWLRSGVAAATRAPAKRFLDALPAEQLLQETVPLGAIYLLAPRPSSAAERAVTRTRLDPTHAAISLVAQTKLGSLLAKEEAAVTLERASRVAERVPVYRLELVREFDLLPAVVESLFEWHGHARTASP